MRVTGCPGNPGSAAQGVITSSRLSGLGLKDRHHSTFCPLAGVGERAGSGKLNYGANLGHIFPISTKHVTNFSNAGACPLA